MKSIRLNSLFSLCLAGALALGASSAHAQQKDQPAKKSKPTVNKSTETAQPADAAKPAATAQPSAESTANTSADGAKAAEAEKKVTNPALDKAIGNQPDTYMATQVIEQNGRVSARLNYARKGKLQRVDIETRDVPLTIIGRPDMQKNFLLRGDKKMFAELPEVNPFATRVDPFDLQLLHKRPPRGVKVEFIGTEKIGGYTCNKWRILFDQAKMLQTVTVWKAVELKDLIIRQEYEQLNIKSSVELQNISMDVPDDTFDLPKDFQKVANRLDMFPAPEKAEPPAELPVPQQESKPEDTPAEAPKQD